MDLEEKKKEEEEEGRGERGEEEEEEEELGEQTLEERLIAELAAEAVRREGERER